MNVCDSLASSGVVDDVTDQEVTETKTVDGRMKLDAAAFSVDLLNKTKQKIQTKHKTKGHEGQTNKQTNK